MAAEALVDELEAARADFFGALDAVAPESLATPGLVGEWSARELVAHLGYWVGHVVDVIHAVEEDRVRDLYAERAPVDEVNETVARVARSADFSTVRAREAASVEALVDRLRTMDPALLAAALPSGHPVEALVREDGVDHYREHARELRDSLGGPRA
jgi:hypothetical protein